MRGKHVGTGSWKTQMEHEIGSVITVLAPPLCCTSHSIISRLREATVPLYSFHSKEKKMKSETIPIQNHHREVPRVHIPRVTITREKGNSVSGWLRTPGTASLPPKQFRLLKHFYLHSYFTYRFGDRFASHSLQSYAGTAKIQPRLLLCSQERHSI